MGQHGPGSFQKCQARSPGLTLKSWSWLNALLTPSLEGGDWGIAGTCWPASLAETLKTPDSSGDPVSRWDNEIKRDGGGAEVLFGLMHMLTKAQACAHMHTCAHTP